MISKRALQILKYRYLLWSRRLPFGSPGIVGIVLAYILTVALQTSEEASHARVAFYERFGSAIVLLWMFCIPVITYFGTRASSFRRTVEECVWEMRLPRGIRFHLFQDLVVVPFFLNGLLATVWVFSSRGFTDLERAIQFGLAIALLRSVPRMASFLPGISEIHLGRNLATTVGIPGMVAGLVGLSVMGGLETTIGERIMAPVMVNPDLLETPIEDTAMLAALALVASCALVLLSESTLLAPAYSLAIESIDLREGIANRFSEANGGRRPSRFAPKPGWKAVVWSSHVSSQRMVKYELRLVVAMTIAGIVVWVLEPSMLWISGIALAVLVAGGSVNQPHVFELARVETRPAIQSWSLVLAAIAVPVVRSMGLLVVPSVQIACGDSPFPSWFVLLGVPSVATLAVLASAAFSRSGTANSLILAKVLLLVVGVVAIGPLLAHTYSQQRMGLGAVLGLVIAVGSVAGLLFLVLTSRVGARSRVAK